MNETKKVKLLSPKLDVVFQALFGEIGSERITKDFLETILRRKIDEINLEENQILRRRNIKDKLGILDVIVKINGEEKCDVEMQMVEQTDIIERILYYWAKLYTKGIHKGEYYEVLQKTIVILISDKKIKSLKDIEEYHTVWKIMETESGKKILTDKLEFHIIEIEKMREYKEDDKLIDWIEFLNNPKSERVRKKMEENKALKEAGEKLEEMSEDERLQKLAWWIEKGEMDRGSELSHARKDGIEEGIKQGIEQGITKKAVEIARKMKKEHEDINKIMLYTGLTKEEIEKIK